MMAAVAAAERGAAVTLLDPNERLGKKLNITGKGRCNVTSNADRAGAPGTTSPGTENSSAVRPHPVATGGMPWRFLRPLGVPLKTERGNRVFPVSDRAFDVSAALERRLKDLHVRIVRDRAAAVETADGAVTAVRGERGTYPADAVILATGGVSYPATGSTGEGHRIARELGHTVTDLRGSLVPLRDYGLGRTLQGLSLRNIGLTVFENGKRIYTDFGEMLFTHFGVSGPVILSASAHMRHFDKKTYRLEIDLKPALDDPALDRRLLRDFEKYANHDFCNALDDLLPQKLIGTVVERSRIPPHEKVHDVTREQRRELAQVLKHFAVDIAGPCPVTDAIVTSGGVKVGEIDPKTMASKIVKGLILRGRTHRCGRLHRRLQPADRLGHRPGGGHPPPHWPQQKRGAENMNDQTIRVAIDGPSGAGKSTLARRRRREAGLPVCGHRGHLPDHRLRRTAAGHRPRRTRPPWRLCCRRSGWS